MLSLAGPLVDVDEPPRHSIATRTPGEPVDDVVNADDGAAAPADLREGAGLTEAPRSEGESDPSLRVATGAMR